VIKRSYRIKIKISRVLWRKILSYKIGKPFSSHNLAAYEQLSYSKAIFHAADHHMSIKLDELKKGAQVPLRFAAVWRAKSLLFVNTLRVEAQPG